MDPHEGKVVLVLSGATVRGLQITPKELEGRAGPEGFFEHFSSLQRVLRAEEDELVLLEDVETFCGSSVTHSEFLVVRRSAVQAVVMGKTSISGASLSLRQSHAEREQEILEALRGD